MKKQVISYGQNKKGIKTAQIVLKADGKSWTRHVWNIGGRWLDKDGRPYDI